MLRFRSSLLLCAAALLFCAGCTSQQPPPPSSQSTLPDAPSVPVMAPYNPSDSTESAPDAPAPDVSNPIPVSPPLSEDSSPSPQPPVEPEPLPPHPPAEPTPPPQQVTSETPPAPKPTPSSVFPVISDYDFSQPVPECTPVENDFFADAAFVGDSRMEGFYLYSGIKKGKKLATTGLSVFNLDQKTVLTSGGTHYTLPNALELTQYGKIYLGFGINELGYINQNAFYEAYCQAIDTIRSRQPNAVIYAQTMIPVNEDRVRASGGAGHLNNDRLRMYNNLIRQAAQEKQIPILDLYAAFAADGTLPAEASRDGVHLTGDYCKMQLEYLKTHTIDFATLYTPIQAETEVPTHEATTGPDPVTPFEPDPDLLLPEAEQLPLPSDSSPDASGD